MLLGCPPNPPVAQRLSALLALLDVYARLVLPLADSLLLLLLLLCAWMKLPRPAALQAPHGPCN